MKLHILTEGIKKKVITLTSLLTELFVLVKDLFLVWSIHVSHLNTEDNCIETS